MESNNDYGKSLRFHAELKSITKTDYFDYLSHFIDFMAKHYTNDTEEFFKKYEEKFKKLDDNTENRIDNGRRLMSGMQLEGMIFGWIAAMQVEMVIMRQAAILEKILIDLSYLIQETKENPIPPDFNISSNYFTDSLQAVVYIEKLTNIKIKKLKQWETINKIRNLRHRLSHGLITFEIKEKEYEAYNKLFYIEKNGQQVGLLVKDNTARVGNSFMINQLSICNLKNENLPEIILEKLEKLKNKKYDKKEEFIDKLKESIGSDEFDKYSELIFTNSEIISDKIMCRVTHEIEILSKINKICCDFINELKLAFEEEFPLNIPWEATE